MPFYLKHLNVAPEVAAFRSALIVVCRFCPAASVALKHDQPYLRLFRNFINTACYEEYINDVKAGLEQEGLRTGVFKGNMLRSPFNFIICMWSSWQRRQLSQRAHDYEAVVVLGCEAAYETVCDILKSTHCRVFRGMESEGVFSVTPKYHWPASITLSLERVTPMRYQKESGS